MFIELDLYIILDFLFNKFFVRKIILSTFSLIELFLIKIELREFIHKILINMFSVNNFDVN